MGDLPWCADHGYDLAVVLGGPDYYHRFGFASTAPFGIRCPFDVPPEVFMLKPLREIDLNPIVGMVKYEPEFEAV